MRKFKFNPIVDMDTDEESGDVEVNVDINSDGVYDFGWKGKITNKWFWIAVSLIGISVYVYTQVIG